MAEESLVPGEKCIQLQQQACSQSGSESVELSYAWNRVGISLNMCKLYSKAMPYFEQTKRIRRSLPGFVPVHLLGAHYNMAVALFGQGLIKEAEALLLQTLAEWEEVNGPDNKASFRYSDAFHHQVYKQLTNIDPGTYTSPWVISMHIKEGCATVTIGIIGHLTISWSQ
jgi:tetratricopeptide (TPR) repeat protein